jgi:hypothetical protein
MASVSPATLKTQHVRKATRAEILTIVMSATGPALWKNRFAREYRFEFFIIRTICLQPFYI